MRPIRLSLLLVCACAAPELNQVEQGILCPREVCGTNSPEIEQLAAHDFEMTKAEANEAGFRLSGFLVDGRDYDLVVENAQLRATSPAFGTVTGQGLVGAYILVEYQGIQYGIRVSAVSSLQIPIPSNDPSQPTVVETYELDYAQLSNLQPASEWKNLCGGTELNDLGDPEYGFRETFGQPAKYAILFEGDRIDTDSMTIDPRHQPTWFNIGCSGHTLAKLFLTRNATVSLGRLDRHPQRQATLKMLVADYCGDGTPFTAAGQSLVWMGDQVNYFADPRRLEARWDERGATCLEVPRMTYPTTRAGATRFRDIEQQIAAQCRRPPRCEDREPTSLGGALRVSAIH
jgi:hypothetical protein